MERLKTRIKNFMSRMTPDDTRFLARPRPPRFWDAKLTVLAAGGLVLLSILIDVLRHLVTR